MVTVSFASLGAARLVVCLAVLPMLILDSTSHTPLSNASIAPVKSKLEYRSSMTLLQLPRPPSCPIQLARSRRSEPELFDDHW